MGDKGVGLDSGVAGAALAKRLAERGVHVLVLERATVFRDRLRGEQRPMRVREGESGEHAYRTGLLVGADGAIR